MFKVGDKVIVNTFFFNIDRNVMGCVTQLNNEYFLVEVPSKTEVGETRIITCDNSELKLATKLDEVLA